MTKKLGILLGMVVLTASMTAFGATATVTISNDTFTDNTSGGPTTTINAGDTVTWQWHAGTHSTTSGTCSSGGGAYGEPGCTSSGVWDSGIRSSGSFSHDFPAAGNFSYFCQVHGSMMTGTVIVRQATSTCNTITLQPSSLPAGIQGSAYETVLTASGGTAPYAFTLASGSLPPGIHLDDSGELSGTPTATGAFSFSVRAADGSANHCSGTQAFSVTIDGDSPAGDTVVIPGVGSLAGQGGADFKTELQLTNPGLSPIAGKIVYHAGGASGSANDPSLSYTLASWQTVDFADVLAAMDLSGLGSADIVPTSGPAPVAVVKIFNDDGANGTAGFTEPIFRAQDALQSGDEAVLVLPADATNFRFNLGVRTLGDGISATFTIWDESGELLNTVQKTFPATFFAQAKATDFLGVSDLPANGSIGITVTHGSGIFFGSTVDNRGSQDTSTQFTRH
jgi:plastocyanin